MRIEVLCNLKVSFSKVILKGTVFEGEKSDFPEYVVAEMKKNRPGVLKITQNSEEGQKREPELGKDLPKKKEFKLEESNLEKKKPGPKKKDIKLKREKPIKQGKKKASAIREKLRDSE